MSCSKPGSRARSRTPIKLLLTCLGRRTVYGIGRRYKKRRTSPASTIEVGQIEEEGVAELVVVEEETEKVAEIAIVELGGSRDVGCSRPHV